jgi:Transcriptional regulator PadR-like family
LIGKTAQAGRASERLSDASSARSARVSFGREVCRHEFESRTGEVWPLNVGQVYTTLQRLERDGLVEADGAGEQSQKQKRYRITSAGVQELADWLRTPPQLVPPPRDELVIKVLVALQVPGIA